MKNRRNFFIYFYLLIVLVFLCTNYLQAQTGEIVDANKSDADEKLLNFIKNINTFTHLYPQEKVYLHFDNTAYYLGETIWFKAYVTIAENNLPADLSKVLYTELLSPEGDVLEIKKYKIEAGTAYGDFIVRDSLFAGYYEIRAYTRSMLNFDKEIVFSRVFPVFDNPGNTGNYTAKKMTVRERRNRVPVNREKEPGRDGIDIIFFPEGGNLIGGITNRVAFKVTNKNGQGIDASGLVYDSSGNEITTFSSQHRGMGFFDIVPSAGGEKYYARVTYNGKESKADLPKTFSSGYSLRVNNLHPGNVMIQVEKTPDIISQELGLSISCRGKVHVFHVLKVDNNGQSVIQIPKMELPSGVIQLTLFTPEGEVLAERLVFIDRNDSFVKVKTSVTGQGFEACKPIRVDFEVADSNGNPVETNLSLSVRDKGTTIETFYADDIRTNLLLSSDLKGYIEDPGYYFENDDMEHKIALDLLMMVQGWRRYEWKQMAGIVPFKLKYGIEHALLIEGYVSSTLLRKRPQENIDMKIWLMNLSQGGSRQGTCVTDKEGKFNFALDDIYGDWELGMQVMKKGKRKYMNIVLDRNFSPPARCYAFYENTLPEILNSENSKKKAKELLRETSLPKGIIRERAIDMNLTILDDSIKSHMLDEVVIKAKEKPKVRDAGYKYANIIYDVNKEVDKILDNNESYVDNVIEFLLSSNIYFLVDSKNKFRYKGRRVNFYFEGTEEPEEPGGLSKSRIGDISLSEIKSIAIVEFDPFSFNHEEDRAAVYLYFNKKGKRKNDPKGIRNTYFIGYSYPREFYSPDYTYGTLPDEKDFRRTLYWNPNVITNNRGKASVRFFNNSTCKDLDVSVEGLTKEGVPVLIKR